MDPYKKHREKLLLEEYKIHSEKTNKLTALIWYLSTGVFTVIGLVLTNLVINPLDCLESFLIITPAVAIILLYLVVSNRWHTTISRLYERMKLLEERLGFDGNLLIARKDKPTVKNPIKYARIVLSIIFIIILLVIPFLKTNKAKDCLDRIFILNGCAQPNESIVNSTQVMGIKSSNTFIIYFPKGSLLVENNYLSNKKTIIALTNYLKDIPATSTYKAMIVGYSCIERINSNTNRVNNNYELSKARTENIKFFINDLMLTNNSQLKKIEYVCGGFSNQKIFSKKIDEQRRVEITFYEISNIHSP